MRAPAATPLTLVAALLTTSALLTGCSGSEAATNDITANDIKRNPLPRKTFLAPMKLDDGTREAVYEVTGPLPADITYEKVAPDSAAQTVSVEARKTALPWSATVDVPEDVDSLRLTVTSVDTENEADFSCRILVDGREVARDSDSLYASCDADGIVTDDL